MCLHLDFGITKIRTYDNSEEINVTHLFVSGNKIYKDSICVCGDRIIMLTKDGLYEFDGISTKRLILKSMLYLKMFITTKQ